MQQNQGELERLWTQIKGSIVDKNASDRLLKKIKMRTYGSISADYAALINADIQEERNKLTSLLQHTLESKIEIWDVISPTFVKPSQPIDRMPDLIAYPSIVEPGLYEATSYKSKPQEPAITIDDMRREESTIPAQKIDTPVNQPQNNWITNQFKNHPLICWGLVGLLILALFSGN